MLASTQQRVERQLFRHIPDCTLNDKRGPGHGYLFGSANPFYLQSATEKEQAAGVLLVELFETNGGNRRNIGV
jgi:hypothetical protein